jgi:hypothetical protein
VRLGSFSFHRRQPATSDPVETLPSPPNLVRGGGGDEACEGGGGVTTSRLATGSGVMGDGGDELFFFRQL